MTAKDILKILKQNGFIIKSQNKRELKSREKGSHIKLVKDDRSAVVPNHGKKDVP